jgi:hypothetical protein
MIKATEDEYSSRISKLKNTNHPKSDSKPEHISTYSSIWGSDFVPGGESPSRVMRKTGYKLLKVRRTGGCQCLYTHYFCADKPSDGYSNFAAMFDFRVHSQLPVNIQSFIIKYKENQA